MLKHLIAWLPLVLALAASPGHAADQPPRPPEPAYQGKPLSFWLKGLKSPEVLVREESTLVLGEMGSGAVEAVPALKGALRDESSLVRVRAARALGKIDPQCDAILPVLADALQAS